LRSARLWRAFFGVAPKTVRPDIGFDAGSGATPEPTRGTRVLPNPKNFPTSQSMPPAPGNAAVCRHAATPGAPPDELWAAGRREGFGLDTRRRRTYGHFMKPNGLVRKLDRLQTTPHALCLAAMVMRISSIFFVGLSILGCQTEGDFGTTIVKQVADYGGHTRSSATIPELRGTVSVRSTDSEGFQAHLSGIRFTEFKLFMQRVYGDPVFTMTASGHDWGTPGHIYYRAADIGVSIEFFPEPNGVRFICHRGHAYHLL